MKKFINFNLKPSTISFIEKNHFEVATPIQDAVIPYAIKQNDIIGISETGTGKTHAFLIPIMEMIDSSQNRVQAVIISPTRELAMQTYKFASKMKEVDEELSIYLSVGGKGKEMLNPDHQPNLVIGTPGRIKDLFLNEQFLRLDRGDLVVIDEADMIFELGFLEDVDAVISKMSKSTQLLAFSATIPQALKLFLRKYMKHPKMVHIEDHLSSKANVTNVLIPAKHLSYHEKLLQILSGFQPYVCLIFANTREEAEQTAEFLRNHQYKILELHGNLSARQRKNALKTLQSHEYSYIVATDIAARGLDIEGITHVVSLGFPMDLNFFIHRSGRTGRNKREGTCYTIYKAGDESSIKKLQVRGVKFHHMDIKNDKFYELKPIFYKRQSKDDELEKEISKSLQRKKKVVKPNHKKKQKETIQKLKQRKKRDIIRNEIKSAQKERAKSKQKRTAK